MNNFFKHLKKVSITFLSVIIIICSIPQFSIRSQAVGTTSVATYSILYFLTTYFATRGYSIINDSNNTFTSLAQWREESLEDISDVLYEISVKLNNFGSDHNRPGLGDEFIKALSLAALTGSFIISKEAQILVDLWLSEETDAVTGSVDVGTTTQSIQNFSQPSLTKYYISSSRYIQFDCDAIAITRVTNELDTSGSVLFVPSSIDDFVFNVATGAYEMPVHYRSGINWSTITTHYNGNTYVAYGDSFSKLQNYVHFTQIYDSITGHPTREEIFNLYLSGQLADVEGGSLSINRINDTTSTDILSSSNEIAQDGSVTGGFTLYLPDEATLVDLIDRYNDQSITYDELIEALGLAVVASSATVTEKENALSDVAVPDNTYNWFTRTMWGAETISETTADMTKTHSEEDSIADSIGDTLKGGNDSQDDNDKNRGKGLLAALLIGLGIWSTPIIAGDPLGESDSGGTDDGSSDDDSHPGYLQDTIAGMAIAGTVMDSFFSAAGGSDGYGFVYTVGASFVIFSVVIGAANYFGALFHGDDIKQMKKSSAKNNSPNKTRKQSSYSNKNGIVT